MPKSFEHPARFRSAGLYAVSSTKDAAAIPDAKTRLMDQTFTTLEYTLIDLFMAVGYLSFSPQFFLRLNREMIVFGHDQLPAQLHLTCSFDPRSDDANIHVTKENGKRRKPKVTVALTKKINLEKNTFVDPFQLFNSVYEP